MLYLKGRNYLTLEDIPLLIKVVLSTASIERVMVFDLLLANEWNYDYISIGKEFGNCKIYCIKNNGRIKYTGIGFRSPF